MENKHKRSCYILWDNFQETDMLCNLFEDLYDIKTFMVHEIYKLENICSPNDFVILYVNVSLSQEPNGLDNLQHLHVPFYITSISSGYHYLPFIRLNPYFRGVISVSSLLKEKSLLHSIPCLQIRRRKYVNTNVLKYLYKPCMIGSIVNSYEFNSHYFRSLNHSPIVKDSWVEFEKIMNVIPNFRLYGSNPKGKGRHGYVDREQIFSELKYLVHIKHWGHVCNVVIECIAYGIPVIMDKETYVVGGYESYLQHNFNCLIFNTTEEIVEFLQSKVEHDKWSTLRTHLLRLVSDYQLPFSNIERQSSLQFIEDTIMRNANNK